ncbi:NAD(P)H-dependent oxidoreductase [Helicobacter zhangjianzhongii]|uniref:NAD(P)H-dependent oxidoreductase n=1 Tax=Helicobacter zhangjianzhongii TaxID=2974574 RepID=A0ACC6FUV2_9HELI|nr:MULTISPECIES: NAD(P)H-dependent oxidoreductase [unclassified Helicobacter]MDL0080787.1 NAD(P)H-dependent oxidoreductase [Helicobacter sp. CPD2-1]MDL0082687.1 NAD(P)H-dependent oxidoreductase [Helicobacter sp. XJK30-2]
MQTLLLFSHTFWDNSKVNKALLESAKSLPNLTIHNLNVAYPNGTINVAKEVELLEKAQKIIFQFPLFWFSTPALMKEWQDRVLTHILYGENPKLLHGKSFQVITTLGGSKDSYDGHHGYSLETILTPLTSTFSYCGCEVLESYAIFSAKVDSIPTQEYLSLLG